MSGKKYVGMDVHQSSTVAAVLDEHAPHLRADFDAHFPEGVELAREVWVTMQSWSAETPTDG